MVTNPLGDGPGLWPGSGRFYGAVSEQGFIQQPGNPGNNGYIGQVKNIPAKAPGRPYQCERAEIRHRSIGEAVDGIADGAAR